jgi:hypothetical protein
VESTAIAWPAAVDSAAQSKTNAAASSSSWIVLYESYRDESGPVVYHRAYLPDAT